MQLTHYQKNREDYIIDTTENNNRIKTLLEKEMKRHSYFD